VSDPSYRVPAEPDSNRGADFALQIAGKRVVLVGRLGSMNRREAKRLIASFGAVVVPMGAKEIDYVVIGADEPPLAETELLSREMLAAASAGDFDLINEDEFWQRLGLLDNDKSSKQLYTPAMLADLLSVPVQVIRRWHRRGLITATQTLHRLPYFEFQEVAAARRLANWIASGASPHAIEQRLVELVEFLPDIQRPLDQLSILVEGKDILMRQGDGLLDLGGQLRFDFPAVESVQGDEKPDDGPSRIVNRKSSLHQAAPRDVISINESDEKMAAVASTSRENSKDDELLQALFEAEEADDLELAIQFCHAILARDGPNADISFQLAELLYRTGEITGARERYYCAIELDPDFVEARSSLANVLAETGQPELAIAAFAGALSLHPSYVEAHFGLAKLHESLGNHSEAQRYWQNVIQFAPESRWANEAHARIAALNPNHS
jgi:tetratricopeptide (TPR) repeat protein